MHVTNRRCREWLLNALRLLWWPTEAPSALTITLSCETASSWCPSVCSRVVVHLCNGLQISAALLSEDQRLRLPRFLDDKEDKDPEATKQASTLCIAPPAVGIYSAPGYATEMSLQGTALPAFARAGLLLKSVSRCLGSCNTIACQPKHTVSKT